MNLIRFYTSIVIMLAVTLCAPFAKAVGGDEDITKFGRNVLRKSASNIFAQEMQPLSLNANAVLRMVEKPQEFQDEKGVAYTIHLQTFTQETKDAINKYYQLLTKVPEKDRWMIMTPSYNAVSYYYNANGNVNQQQTTNNFWVIHSLQLQLPVKPVIQLAPKKAVAPAIAKAPAKQAVVQPAKAAPKKTPAPAKSAVAPKKPKAPAVKAAPKKPTASAKKAVGAKNVKAPVAKAAPKKRLL